MPLDPGNTLTTAYNFGNLSGNTNLTWNESVSSSDLNDYYRFSLSASSNFSLSLNGLSADADLQIINSSGAVLAQSTNGGAAAESLTGVLAAGEYYVRVFSFNGASTSYQLGIQGAGAAIDPGSALSTAFDLGTFSDRTYTWAGTVGGADTGDVYEVNLAETRVLNLGLSGLSADADLQLFNSSGTLLAASENFNASPEAIARQLEAGTYYVRVYPFGSASTNYSLSVSDSIPDFAGNTLDTARPIAIGSTDTTYSDFVGSTDTNDYYRFTLTGPNLFSLNLTGLSADADVQLLSSTGSVLASSDNTNTTAETLSNVALTAGTYYIRVYPFSGNTTYNLSVRAVPDLEPNDSLGTASDLGGLSDPRTVQGFVGGNDSNDYYRFTVDSTRVFNLSMTGLTADADVVLLDGNGFALRTSENAGNTAETIANLTLTAGTYYVRVYPFYQFSTGVTPYTLNLSAVATTTPGDPYESNNTLGTAFSLGSLASPRTIQGYVGGSDTNDYYRFTVSTASVFNLSLTGLGADADVALLDGSGNQLRLSENGSNLAEAINNVLLSAGTYYVWVYPYSGSTHYTLNLNAATYDAYESNNTLDTAYSLGRLEGNRSLQATIGGSDPNDYYRFSVGTTSLFSLNLTGLSADADVQLLSSTGAVIASSINGGVTSELINQTLSAGTYYVRVYPFGGQTNYTLSLGTTPTTPTNPTPTAANWTFLVYMSSDNLEQFAIEDFLEMAAVGSTANVNVVVQLDRTAGYDTRYGDWTDARRGLIRQNDTPGLTWGSSVGEVDMGDTNTLRDFVTWGMTNYTATNYALVLWGHGSGLQASYDDITGNGITATELSSALAGQSSPMALIGTDACLMGMTEFAYQIRNLASVFVGSQELEPGDGWDYTPIVNDLTSTPTMTATQLAQSIVTRYGQFYNGTGNDPFVAETLSAIDLTAFRSATGLPTALSQLGTTIMTTATDVDRRQLQTYRNSFANFGDGSFPRYVDLGRLLSALVGDSSITAGIRTAAQTALTAYNGAVIQNYTQTSGRSTGLSITLQSRGNTLPSSYNDLAFANDTAWDEFLGWWTTA